MDQAAWIWWLSGGVLAAAGLVLLWWSLFRDRARGRRRCPRCWYDMAGVPGLVCPECGRDAIRESRLGRTRRRPRWAVVAMTVIVGGASGALLPKLKNDGVLSLVPTPMLLRLATQADVPREWDQKKRKLVQSPIDEELARRDAQSNLSSDQWRWLIENKGLIEFPERWPVGKPLYIKMMIPEWFDFIELRARASPEVTLYQRAGQKYILTSGTGLPADWYEGYRQVELDTRLGPLPRLYVEVEAASSLFSKLRSTHAAGGELWAGDIECHTEWVQSADEVFAVERGEDWDEYIRQELEVRTYVNLSDPRISSSVTVSFSRGLGKPIDDIALGFMLSLVRDGQLMASRSFMAHELDPRQVGQPYRARISTGRAFKEEMVTYPDRFVIRIHGTPDLALTDFDRQRAWSGSIEVPLGPTLQVRSE